MTKRRLKMSNPPPPVVAGSRNGGSGAEQSKSAAFRPGDRRPGYPASRKIRKKIKRGGVDLKTRVRFGFMLAILASLVTVPVSLLLIFNSGRRPVEVLFGPRLHFLELLAVAVLCFFLGALVIPPVKKR